MFFSISKSNPTNHYSTFYFFKAADEPPRYVYNNPTFSSSDPDKEIQDPDKSIRDEKAVTVEVQPLSEMAKFSEIPQSKGDKLKFAILVAFPLVFFLVGVIVVGTNT